MLPAFPPKKLFSLTPAEVEQRREQLEKYMQAGEWLKGIEADSVEDDGESQNSRFCRRLCWEASNLI